MVIASGLKNLLPGFYYQAIDRSNGVWVHHSFHISRPLAFVFAEVEFNIPVVRVVRAVGRG